MGVPARGFSLIELIMVIAVIGVLSSIAVPAYNSYREKVRGAAAVLAIGVIAKEIIIYYQVNGRYPDSLAEVGQNAFLDPWGHPYQYLRISCAGQTARQRGGQGNERQVAGNSGSGRHIESRAGGLPGPVGTLLSMVEDFLCRSANAANGGTGQSGAGGGNANSGGGNGGNVNSGGGGSGNGGNGGGNANSGGGNGNDGSGCPSPQCSRKDHFMVPINTDFDLYSMGPDGASLAPLTAEASRDDIVRANDGQFIGRASDF